MTSNYHCNYCDEDIKKIRVKCGECPDFDLCLKCFSSGAEIGKHKSKHKYQLIDCGTFTIFESNPKWKASEEMALLEAVELYGFGNWNDISNFIGSKTTEEVKDHFITFYVYGNIGKNTWDVLKNTTLEINDHTCDDDRPISPSFLSTLPEIKSIEPIQQQQLGYMPKRDDFEREFDNEAESVISYLTISVDDDEIDKELKEVHIDVYKRRLKERFRRKKITREYNLVHLFFNQTSEENRDLETKKKSINTFSKLDYKDNGLDFMNSKESIELKMRLLSQYQSQEEQKLLIDNLHKEYLLKQKLKELFKSRKQNIKKTNENKDDKTPKKKDNKKTKMNLMEDIGYVQKSTFCQTNKKSIDEESNINQTQIKIKEEYIKSESQNLAENSKSNELGDDDIHYKKSITISTNSNQDLNCITKISKEKFDVYSMPNSRLLSDQEKKFCNSLKLRPSQYISIKTLILKEHAQKKGKMINTGKSVLENIDKSTHKKMINFMTKCGWLNN